MITQDISRFALIIAATFIFTMAVCVINLPKIQHDVEEKDKMKFKDLFTVIKKNDQLRWADIGTDAMYITWQFRQ